jgi:phosphoglycolate phosphatase
MTKRFDLIVFDWDGTLMDSAAAIVAAIQGAARDLGAAEPDEQRARHVIGLGLHDALRHAVPDLPSSAYPEMVDRYRHHYLSCDQQLTLFSGVREMLAWLAAQPVFVTVATGKSRKGLDRALAHSGLESRFHGSRCADECFSKPHPAMLLELMDEFGVTPERTVMIGDTTHDLQMARNAGVAGVAVSFGAHPLQALEAEAPLMCFHSAPALHEWLRACV